jgi:Tfp pilus assembly protein PilN
MIRINLLPHREEAKKARREQFFVLAGLVSVLGALIVFADTHSLVVLSAIRKVRIIFSRKRLLFSTSNSIKSSD